jgi:S-adenosylmethionine synthetase
MSNFSTKKNTKYLNALRISPSCKEPRSAMRAINIELLRQQSIEKTNIEIVERKGQGHPDYLIDGASEAVSKALCQYYDEKFGVVLHHNVDKGLLVGGRANPYFGDGEIIEPINVIVAGRAITQVTKNGKLT